LPDGVFSNQKFKFGNILECFGMENVDIIYCRLEYFTALWCILWQFDNFLVILGYYNLFWNVLPRKSGNPALQRGFLSAVCLSIH
jgi:hypothetical protein